MKKIIIDFTKKYKIESIASLVVSLISAYLFDLRNNDFFIRLFEILTIFIFVILASFLIDKLFIIYEYKIKKIKFPINVNQKSKNIFNVVKTISYAIIILLEYLLYRLSIYLMLTFYSLNFKYGNVNHDIIFIKCFSLIIVCVFLILLILYFIIKEKYIDIKDYLMKIFMNFLFLLLIEIILLVGFLILYLICDVLLGEIPYYIISRIIIFTITIVSIIGFLVSIENVKGEHSLFSKILIRYIMQIMVFVGFIIFYIYLMKIILTRELPKNQVFAVCTTLFSIGLFTSLMSLAIKEESSYNKLIKYLPVAFVPALVLQIISIILRINQHGLTANRYFCIMIIILEMIYLLYYLFDELLKNKKIKLKNIFLIYDLLILIIFFIPKINVYDFPNIYNSLFKKQTETEIKEFDEEYTDNTITRYKNFVFPEIDISGFNKIKPWIINVYYENNEKKYFVVNKKIEYDNKTIDITDLIDALYTNFNKYQKNDVFRNINNEIMTGNNKMLITYIRVTYDKKIDKISDLNLQGYIITK